MRGVSENDSDRDEWEYGKGKAPKEDPSKNIALSSHFTSLATNARTSTPAIPCNRDFIETVSENERPKKKKGLHVP